MQSNAATQQVLTQMNNILGNIGAPKQKELKKNKKDKDSERDSVNDKKKVSSSDSSSGEEEKRINAIKDAILKEEQDRFKRLSKKF